MKVVNVSDVLAVLVVRPGWSFCQTSNGLRDEVAETRTSASGLSPSSRGSWPLLSSRAHPRSAGCGRRGGSRTVRKLFVLEGQRIVVLPKHCDCNSLGCQAALPYHRLFFVMSPELRDVPKTQA